MLADNPSLTCRLSGLEDCSPVRVILDRDLRIPLDSILVTTAREVPVYVFCSGDNEGQEKVLADAGVEVLSVGLEENGKLSLVQVMTALAERGITRLLAEGGAKLNASLFRSSLVDRLLWFRAPSLIGEEGVPSIGALGLDELANMPVMTPVSAGRSGPDIWEEYRINH